MMTDAQIEVCDTLWREALASGLAQYRLGMVTRGRHVIAGDDPLRVYTSGGVVRVSAADVRLDWSHPATTGCLLALAREATGDPTLYACVVPGVLLDGDDKWCALLDRRRPLIQAHTEPEALLRAILATRGGR